MAVDVIMPQMGESIFEGTITKWLKKPGDRIERDEPLFEISTDKVDAEIPAPSAGVLKEIKVTEGQTVPIQTVVAVIDAAGASSGEAAAAPVAASAPTPAPASTPVPAPQKAPAPKAAAPASPVPPAAPAAQASAAPAPPPAQSTVPAGRGNGKEIRSSPLVRRLAKENQVDLSGVEGSGAGGRISKKDILAAMQSGSAKASAPATPAPQTAAASYAAAPAASAPAAGRDRAPGPRKCRPARANLFRELRSAAHEHDAPAHRRAHGGVQARFASCVFDR